MSEPISRRGKRGEKDTRLSYKYQRLRETIRQAIESGELTGKLPGERALAKKFNANAKTLGKALTDLASEGLLDRSIGRGTYVRGTRPVRARQKWLIVHDGGAVEPPLVAAIKRLHLECTMISHHTTPRPSFLSQFDAVIDVDSATPTQFIRDLVVRGLPVVSVNCEPKIFSTHAVLMDITLGAWRLSRDLLLSGHRHLCAIETGHSNRLLHTIKLAAARYAPEAVVSSAEPHKIESLKRDGVTAIVCDSVELAFDVRGKLEKSLEIPRDLSLVAVGCTNGSIPCSGYFVSHTEHAAALAATVLKVLPHRPTIVWLSGELTDAGTTAPIAHGEKK